MTDLEALPLEGAWTVEDLEALCRRYHGLKGAFAYRAFDWANHTVFDPLPLPLMQWALTPWGGCLGQTRSRPDDVPVITMHPAIWVRSPSVAPDGKGWAERIIPGPRQTLDLILHELVHTDVTYRLGGWSGHSSHDNPQWCAAIERASARLKGTGLDLPHFTAQPTVRRPDPTKKRRSLRVVPDGCLPMALVAMWPYSLRDPSYYETRDVPFAMPTEEPRTGKTSA